jgi:hypothetical protein
MRRTFWVLVFSILLLVSGAAVNVLAGPENSGRGKSSSRFEFALIGDVPYDELQETLLANMIEELNDERLAFTTHVGDIKGGNTPCTDDVYYENLARFNTFEDPLVYTPGDNEWTDCHRAGGDPLERLEFLRSVFFTSDQSLGERTLTLRRQSAEYPENARWTRGVVTFATLHIVGSNNNLGRTPENDAEYAARNAANLEWLRSTFGTAADRGSRAVVIMIQANPGFELPPEQRTGFNDFLAALERETLRFSGQVVLVHGDTHDFRIDKPLIASTTGRRVENFTRIEVFGNPDVHWVRASVDPRNPEIFTFEAEIVEENVVDHLP